MLSKISNLYTIPLRPGINAFNNPGRHWMLVASPVPVRVKLGEMPAILLSPGQGLDFDKPDEFDRYEITNPLEEVITVQFWCGFVGFRDDRRDNLESPTEAAGRDFDEIEGDTALDLVPEIKGNRIRRKALLVSNLDPAVTLYVSDFTAAAAGKGNIVVAVPPETAIILPISEPCRLRNDTGATVSCAVSDIYWLRG